LVAEERAGYLSSYFLVRHRASGENTILGVCTSSPNSGMESMMWGTAIPEVSRGGLHSRGIFSAHILAAGEGGILRGHCEGSPRHLYVVCIYSTVRYVYKYEKNVLQILLFFHQRVEYKFFSMLGPNLCQKFQDFMAK
jgi:hypothetical protein